jgi:flagellin
MSQVDVTRIAGNIAALNSLYSLQNINGELAMHQARLATGKRLMEASDDPAGMNIATTFDVRRQGMKTALSAIGDGKNLMANMEGGLKKIQDILVKMRNKALEATADTLGDSERAAIQAQLRAYRDEVADVVGQTQWNGNTLIGDASGSAGGTSASRSFLVDADGGTAVFSFSSGSSGISANQGFAPVGASGSAASASGLGLDDTILTITDSTTANTAMSSITTALNIVKEGVSQVGAFTARLTFKEEALTVAHANTEAAYNRIMNANMAEEQVEASKLLILQQTATAMLAQANTAPQFLLTLFR